MPIRLPRPTYANVAATLALFVALGGTGYAATTIGTSQIANGAVTTAKLANGAANSSKLANNAVTSARIANGAVTAAKLANNAATTARIANNAVTTAKIGPAAVTGAQIAPATITATQIAPASLNGTLFAAGQGPGVNPSKLTVIASGIVNIAGNGAIGSATATCPAGQKAISGGFDTGENAAVEATGATPDGTGWTVVAQTFDIPGAIRASAVCAAQ